MPSLVVGASAPEPVASTAALVVGHFTDGSGRLTALLISRHSAAEDDPIITRSVEHFMALERALGDAEVDALPPSSSLSRQRNTAWLVGRLSQYLSAVQRGAATAKHPSVRSFVLSGKANAVRLSKREGLGLVLEEDDDEDALFQVLVDGFAPIDGEGRAGPAEASGCVGVGDAIVSVDGQSTRGLGYDEVLQRIQSAPDPVIIGFQPAPGAFEFELDAQPPAADSDARAAEDAAGGAENWREGHEATFSGQVRVTACRARGLRQVQQHQDPYASATLLPGGERRQTQCVYVGGDCPEWGSMHDNQLDFAVAGARVRAEAGPQTGPLQVRVCVEVTVEAWNRSIKGDQHLGRALTRPPLLCLCSPRLHASVQLALSRTLALDGGGSIDIKLQLSGHVSPFAPPANGSAGAGASKSTGLSD
eukprot:g6182.t1